MTACPSSAPTAAACPASLVEGLPLGAAWGVRRAPPSLEAAAARAGAAALAATACIEACVRQ